jgi:spore coat polysaccharide biosynthesis predicted glycosyltransferase SpsG
MSERNLNSIQKFISKSPGFSSVAFSFNLVPQILWADIAITGEGLIKYETCSAGVPTLVISQFDHDSAVLKKFFLSGAAKYLGSNKSISPNFICDHVKKLLDNTDERERLSKNGMVLLDGLGVQRIRKLINQFWKNINE